jgi:uncharacterized C2H2 Zn-finger protein
VLAVKPNSKQIQQKMNKESHQKVEEEELVDCPRCGQIKITKNDKFIFDWDSRVNKGDLLDLNLNSFLMPKKFPKYFLPYKCHNIHLNNCN